MYGSTVAPYVFLWNTGVLVDKENEKKKEQFSAIFQIVWCTDYDGNMECSQVGFCACYCFKKEVPSLKWLVGLLYKMELGCDLPLMSTEALTCNRS